MAILLRTSHPQTVIDGIKRKIDFNQITSWSYDEDGDFVFVEEGIIAWMRPVILVTRVDFYVIGRNDTEMSLKEYAKFHSRFVEMLLAYFPEDCKYMLVTSPFANENDTKNIQTIWQLH